MENLLGFLLLAGIAGLFLYQRRQKTLQVLDDRGARVETLLNDLNARLEAIEQWAASVPGSTFVSAPRTAPPTNLTTSTAAVPPSVPAPVGTPSSAPPSAPAAPPHATVSPPLPATSPALAPRPVVPPRVWSAADVEQLLSGRGLAWLGGLAILIGALFFLGLAFSRGWIGPTTRVAIGLAAGTALMAGGAWFFERREALFGHVLFAVGLGVISIALVAATRLYALVPVAVGLLGALAAAIVATFVAIRARSQIVAAYGLVTALAAPPLLGADPAPATIAFLAVALVGTTTVALFRAWHWLPPVAFLLAAPQLWSWLEGGAGLGTGMVTLLGFGVLHVFAAGGEEWRIHRQRLHPSSATLLLANAAFLVAAGMMLLDLADAADGQGLFLVVLAAAHLLLGAVFLATRGERHPFGMLVFATGIAALTMAVPIQLGGPVVPIAWAAEAVALAWIYAQRSHGYSGVVAVILGALAIGHLLVWEYPFWDVALRADNGMPFLNRNGGTLGFLLLAIGAAAVLVREGQIRAALIAVGSFLAAFALPFEVRTAATVVVGWGLLSIIPVVWARQFAEARVIVLGAAATLLVLGLLLLIGEVAPPERLSVNVGSWATSAAFPSVALAIGALVAPLVIIAWGFPGTLLARGAKIAAGSLAVYAISVGTIDAFRTRAGADTAAVAKQGQVALSILWAALGGTTFVAGVMRWRAAARGFGLALLALATVKVFFFDLASLDATYRVPSFIGLGILLLISSYAYGRLKPAPPATPSPLAATATATPAAGTD